MGVWRQGETLDLPGATANEDLCFKQLPCTVRITQQPLQRVRSNDRAQCTPLWLSHPLVPG